MELRDHSRNQRCPSLGSAAPSFSRRRLCPDLRRKATNCPGLTSRPSHCSSLTSPAPPLPAQPELLFPRFPREARPRAPIGHRPSPEPVTVASGTEHSDWPGPGHVTRLSRTPVSCSSRISAGDSGSTSHWSLDQRGASCQVGSIPAVGGSELSLLILHPPGPRCRPHCEIWKGGGFPQWHRTSIVLSSFLSSPI